jgi:hypothetical protein
LALDRNLATAHAFIGYAKIGLGRAEQELIADMLGVRREGVTDSAGKLQKLGVITYSRGTIRVLDRQRLEHLSCECYAVVKRETDRLLPARRADGLGPP